MRLAYFFVLLPLASYMIFLFYGTYRAFHRISRPLRSGGGYMNRSWESMHLAFILSAAYFLWLFSGISKEIMRTVYSGLSIVAVFFLLRILLMVYLMYLRDDEKSNHESWLDWVFAFSHIVFLASLFYCVSRAVSVLSKNDYSIRSDLLPYMWPVLLLLVVAVGFPLITMYRPRRALR